MTLKAQKLKEQIDTYYKGISINYPDLIKHLKSGKIDNFEPGVTPVGYDVPHQDYYPAIFSFDDKSVLVVTGYSLMALKEIV